MAHGHAATPALDPAKLDVGPLSGRIGFPALLIGAVALMAAVWKGFKDDQFATHFFHSYLAAYTFFMAITLGSLAFVIIQHLTRAGWSVTVRRVAEGLSLNMFLMVVLMLPLFFSYHGENGVQRLLHWYGFNPNAANADDILKSKYGYLNPQFFAIRLGVYLAVWCFMAWFYASRSAQQDHDGDPKASLAMERISFPGIIFFGFSLTAFIIDWVMSLNAHWFSTIFGVYFFAGCMLSSLSAMVLLLQFLQNRGLIGRAVNHEHYHDLGKLMFAFTFFWGYIAFSQYMLIWYANMPEETQFYIPRQWEHWAAISILLLIVHLLIPFPGLLSRQVKRRNAVLAFWSVWSICACALDIYWLVVPNQWINRLPEMAAAKIPGAASNMLLPNAMTAFADPHNIYHVNDAALKAQVNFPLTVPALAVTALCFIGVGGLYVFSTMLALRGKALVPLKDPRLGESLAFENIQVKALNVGFWMEALSL